MIELGGPRDMSAVCQHSFPKEGQYAEERRLQELHLVTGSK